MHSIPVTTETFHKLQSLAIPFVDSPESVIAKLAEAELQRRRQSSGETPSGSPKRPEMRRLRPDAPGDLMHTRVLAATVNGRSLHKPKWNGLLDLMHAIARQRLGTFAAVKAATAANIRDGRFEELGYRFVPEADLSVQGVDANLAWSHSLLLARTLGVSLSVEVQWRNKEGAAYPGESAILSWESAGSKADTDEQAQIAVAGLAAAAQVWEREDFSDWEHRRG